MHFTRRSFLSGASALASIPALGPAVASPSALRAAPTSIQLAPADYGKTPVWSYGGHVPGPLIRLKQGDRLTRRFVNDLPQPSTIHWHGIRIENAMDGVPGLTQSLVGPGASFDYDFSVPDAGTFWYHPHNRTWEQLARGLQGVLIVEEQGDPAYDREEVLVLDDWRLDRDASLHESFGASMDRSHAGRLGNWVTINAKSQPALPARRFERLRLRLVNTATARVFTLRTTGFEGWVVALDGQPLEQPASLADRFRFAPAQRIDLIVDVVASDEAALIAEERGETVVLAKFPVGEEVRQAPLGTPDALPPNPLPALQGLDTARPVDLIMAGGAMGGMQSAHLNGAEQDVRSIAEQGFFWAFNGVVGMTEQPLLQADVGQLVRIRMVNETGWPHAMHLHGHHFRKLGGKDGLGPWRDTELVERGETAEIAFVADNPGKWMFHCHMVDHADSGMMTWIEVG